MKQRMLILMAICMVMSGAMLAQGSFSSGSTGADGAFAPTQSASVQVPASGVFNYTTVTIPAGVTIAYVPNAANTPLTILATGDIDISGSIVVSGQPGGSTGIGGPGGPGGFHGGSGGVNGASGVDGDGPGGAIAGGFTFGGNGGGYQTAGSCGQSVFGSGAQNIGNCGGAYGSQDIILLIGGSGGSGGAAKAGFFVGAGGGGGGGAILIASSTQIVFPSSGTAGLINANGGGGGVSSNNGSEASGGGGSGGAIHLMANTITGLVQLTATGGVGGCANPSSCPSESTPDGFSGGAGYVRVDAFSLSGFNPTSGFSISSGAPIAISPNSLPILQLASVAGVSAPAVPVGSFASPPDIVLPSNQTNPVTVVVNSANIPPGTTVTVTAVPISGSTVTASAALSGTTASSTANVSISLPSGFTVLTASTTINLAASNRPMMINGERVDKIEVAAQYGGGSEITYVTRTGRRVNAVR